MKKSNDSVTVLIDQRRAGLLDDRPYLKARIEQSLSENPSLRNEDRLVRRVLDVLDSATVEDATLKNQLRLRRRAVMSAAGRRTAPISRRRVAVAGVVSLLLATALGWIVFSDDGDALRGVTVLDREEITDLTDNLDFYTWLERRELRSGKPANGT